MKEKFSVRERAERDTKMALKINFGFNDKSIVRNLCHVHVLNFSSYLMNETDTRMAVFPYKSIFAQRLQYSVLQSMAYRRNDGSKRWRAMLGAEQGERGGLKIDCETGLGGGGASFSRIRA